MAVTILGFFALAFGSIVFLFVAYLLFLLLFARRKQRNIQTKSATRTIAVLIPAHNEEFGIHHTLDSLERQTYDQQLFDIFVIADNCTDTTAEIARGYKDVHVLERTNDAERGKGYALNWATKILLDGTKPYDGFCIVDADSELSPDFLSVMSPHLTDNDEPQAIQSRYSVSNISESWRSALMSAAFDLVNHVRLLGSENSKGFIGLKGNGMLFSRKTFEIYSWGKSITEDLDFSLDMVQGGYPISYEPQALVVSPMPTNTEQATSQRERWEGGRSLLIREKALPILRRSFRERNWRLFDAALSILTPPLAELFLLTTASLLLSITLFVISKTLFTTLACTVGIVNVLGIFTYIFGGLKTANTPKEAYLALLKAPGYIVWKIILRFKPKNKDKDAWVRTSRQ
jgi:1,2-diacylglycerol 3-beta-glucosyltransferase